MYGQKEGQNYKRQKKDQSNQCRTFRFKFIIYLFLVHIYILHSCPMLCFCIHTQILFLSPSLHTPHSYAIKGIPTLVRLRYAGYSCG